MPAMKVQCGPSSEPMRRAVSHRPRPCHGPDESGRRIRETDRVLRESHRPGRASLQVPIVPTPGRHRAGTRKPVRNSVCQEIRANGPATGSKQRPESKEARRLAWRTAVTKSSMREPIRPKSTGTGGEVDAPSPIPASASQHTRKYSLACRPSQLNSAVRKSAQHNGGPAGLTLYLALPSDRCQASPNSVVT